MQRERWFSWASPRHIHPPGRFAGKAMSKPYIIRNLTRPSGKQPVKIHFDAVFPVVYASGSFSHRGEGYHKATGNTTIIPSAEYFIIRQLWPAYCYPSEAMAMQGIYQPQQQEMFT
jgi:hypothetical protein